MKILVVCLGILCFNIGFPKIMQGFSSNVIILLHVFIQQLFAGWKTQQRKTDEINKEITKRKKGTRKGMKGTNERKKERKKERKQERKRKKK